MPNQEVGAAYVSVYPKLTNDWNSIGTEAASNFSSGISSKAVTIGTALGSVLGKAASAASNLLMANLERGIERSDMLNAFPAMMEQLGYGSDVAEGSIKQIMEHLRGLPTATQDLLPFVQSLTAINRDLEKSTKLGLAFNDMLVAAGASSGNASRAMEMLTKMLASGEYNAQRWASIIEVMPLQMGLLAEEMLGTGATAQQLGEALADGSVSFDELTDAMIRLDQEGGESFASFDEQAHTSSQGIMTSVDNLSNRIATGWQEIIDAIGNEEIAEGLNKLGDAFEQTMGKVAEGITLFKDAISKMPPPVRDALNTMIDDFNVFNAFLDVSTAHAWNDATSTIGEYATTMARSVDMNSTSMELSMDTALAGIKASTSSTWPYVEESVSSAMSDASGSATVEAGKIMSTVGNAWQEVDRSTSSDWASVSDSISTNIGDAEASVGVSVGDILSHFSGLGSRITNAIGSIKFPTPSISWEDASFAGMSLQVPHIVWNARGGYYDDPTLIGVGEAGGELVLPQSGGIMDPFADTVAERVGEDDDRIIAWLDENLPYIIARYTPTIGQRDFDRMARRATA